MTARPENLQIPREKVDLLGLFVHQDRDRFKISQLALDDIVHDPKLCGEIQVLEPTVPLDQNTIYTTLRNLRYSMRGGWGFVLDSNEDWSVEISPQLHEMLKTKIEAAENSFYQSVYRGG